jgi:hypothetical protein
MDIIERFALMNSVERFAFIFSVTFLGMLLLLRGQLWYLRRDLRRMEKRQRRNQSRADSREPS